MHKIYFDGASEPNPGHSAYAFSHIHDGKEIACQCGYIGICTNNFAEYCALYNSLMYCQIIGLRNISIFGDSQLVVQQVNEKYVVKSENLRKISQSCKKLLSELNISVEWVERENNTRADYLSKLPLAAIRS